ncbi:MAG: VWA domain-containing protein [Anaerolineae bacterium]|nr:VWA domain-containing protein [Anaerolineae bacterium]
MSFTNPDAFWLLLLLPVLVFVGWPRLVYRRRRDAASLIIRLILVMLLIIGLAGPQIQRVADKLAVVFLIDASDSISPSLQSAAVDYVRVAADAMEEQDQAAVVVFGSNALVEIPITQQLELVQVGSDPIRLNTDLAEAMRLGLALFPADTAKRMVILSDGKQTVGDAEEVARLAAATNVQVDYVFLGDTTPGSQFAGPEILVSNVDVPAVINEGEQFSLTVTLESNYRNSLAELRILSRGQVIQRREIELPLGVTNEVFEMVASSTGFADFHVVVEPRSADTFYQNNQLSAFTEVTGPPRVLLVASDDREIESLRSVLEETGLQIDVQGPRDLPIGLAPLSTYDSIVLANVSATDLTPDRMAYLQAYVRDLGGGLVVIGGPNSYGVGGYFETPLEEMLPVEMRLRDKERIPQLTMLFVIDRSGSMEMSSTGGVSNLELAKEAVARSLDLLNDNDRVGVMSFDTGAYYVVELQTVGDVSNRQRIREMVGTLRPGGGTNIRQGVLQADQVLRDDPSQLKHIILLTDGGSDPVGIVPAIDRMNQNYQITTSVVAVGLDSAEWLRDVAEAGHGKYHLAFDVSTIPAIFTAETLLATRSYIFEQEFFPALTARHPIMAGFDSAPALEGYIATTPKDTATVILTGPEDDPILAVWQYGLGRSVAFTSDASSRWAANWIDWPGYADFWSQAIRWSITEGNTNNVEARIVERGEDAVLVVDVRDSQGNYLNGLQLQASVVDSRLNSDALTLRQTAPGRYEATFTPEREGAYFVTVAGSTPEDPETLAPPQSVVQTTGWVLSYSAEYRVDEAVLGQDSPLVLMQRVSGITGGRSLRDRPDGVFLHDLNQEQAAQPVWQYFVLLALLLLPVDVAIRRLVITQTDLQKARDVLAGWLGNGRQPVYAGSGGPSERMGRLLDAKGRVHVPRSQSPESEAGESSPAASSQVPPPTRRRSGRARVPRSAPSVSRSTRRSEPPPDSQAEGTLASRLLKSRRTSEDDQGDS